MITPNISIKLTSIYMLFGGITSLFIFDGINRTLGLFMIIYSIVILQRLSRSGRQLYKLTLLKINHILYSSITILFSIYLLKYQLASYHIIIVPITVIFIIANYISLKMFRFKSIY